MSVAVDIGTKLLLGAALGFLTRDLAFAASQDVDDWLVTGRSVQVNGMTTFPGCAVHTQSNVAIERSIANLRARANMIRGRHLVISGSSSLRTDGHQSGLRSNMVEESQGYQGPVLVIEERLVDYHGQRFRCQFIAEAPSR
jgi:hypothetical protein